MYADGTNALGYLSADSPPRSGAEIRLGDLIGAVNLDKRERTLFRRFGSVERMFFYQFNENTVDTPDSQTEDHNQKIYQHMRKYVVVHFFLLKNKF